MVDAEEGPVEDLTIQVQGIQPSDSARRSR